MTWIIEHWLVLLLLALYTAMIAHHALIGRRKTHGLVDYYVGGRELIARISDPSHYLIAISNEKSSRSFCV